MKYKTYTNVLNVYSRKYPSPMEATKIQRGVCGEGGGGGDRTSSPVIGGGSKGSYF